MFYEFGILLIIDYSFKCYYIFLCLFIVMIVLCVYLYVFGGFVKLFVLVFFVIMDSIVKFDGMMNNLWFLILFILNVVYLFRF